MKRTKEQNDEVVDYINKSVQKENTSLIVIDHDEFVRDVLQEDYDELEIEYDEEDLMYVRTHTIRRK
jgi:3-isopropylmalate dehydratase small subunit